MVSKLQNFHNAKPEVVHIGEFFTQCKSVFTAWKGKERGSAYLCKSKKSFTFKHIN